jgi:hypothetical protein
MAQGCSTGPKRKPSSPWTLSQHHILKRGCLEEAECQGGCLTSSREADGAALEAGSTWLGPAAKALSPPEVDHSESPGQSLVSEETLCEFLDSYGAEDWNNSVGDLQVGSGHAAEAPCKNGSENFWVADLSASTCIEKARFHTNTILDTLRRSGTGGWPTSRVPPTFLMAAPLPVSFLCLRCLCFASAWCHGTGAQPRGTGPPGGPFYRGVRAARDSAAFALVASLGYSPSAIAVGLMYFSRLSNGCQPLWRGANASPEHCCFTTTPGPREVRKVDWGRIMTCHLCCSTTHLGLRIFLTGTKTPCMVTKWGPIPYSALQIGPSVSYSFQ